MVGVLVGFDTVGVNVRVLVDVKVGVSVRVLVGVSAVGVVCWRECRCIGIGCGISWCEDGRIRRVGV